MKNCGNGYKIKNAGSQVIKAPKAQGVKHGKTTIKTGTDLRTGK